MRIVTFDTKMRLNHRMNIEASYMKFCSLVAVLFSMVLTAFAPAGEPGNVAVYQVGDAVANFRLKNVDGNMVSLADYGQVKGVVVVFTSNHCPFAKAYEDRIISLHNKFAGQGYPVIAINPSDPATHPDDSFDKMRERASAKSYAYPYLADDTQQVAKAFGAARMPQVFVLQRTGGKFVVRYIGMLDDNPQDPGGVTKRYAEQAIADLTEGKPIVTTITKPVGCAIKWKN